MLNGTVLVTGGFASTDDRFDTGEPALSKAELYDPSNGSFHPTGVNVRAHSNFASALASFRMGISGSASFQSLRKSWYAVRAFAVSPCIL